MRTAGKDILSYLSGFKNCLDLLPIEELALATEKILVAYRENRLVAIAGNGGSAATASHLACDLGKTILGATAPGALRRFRVIALTDNVPLITAWANDASYDTIFAEQVRAWVGPGDVLIVMSVSGNSPNVVEAVIAARQLGAYTIGFLGSNGGRVKELLDLPVVVPSLNYGHVEDLHMVFSHMITASIREAVARASLPAPVVRVPKALILAAGEGTRLRPLTQNLPKVMLPVNGRPLLEHTVEWLSAYGISDIAVNLHYKPEAIVKALGDGSRWNVRLTYSHENPIMGTAGAVRQLQGFLGKGPFVVVYGDVLTDLNLQALIDHHRATVARDPATAATISLYRSPNPTEVGLVHVEADGRVTRFIEKPQLEDVFTDLANAGVLIVEPDVIDRIPEGTFYDFGHDLFPQLLQSAAHIYGWTVPPQTYLMDIGTPSRYAQAAADWSRRQAFRLPELVKPELALPAMSRPAVFLDRDGVINYNRDGYVTAWSEFEFLPGALDALYRLARLPLPIVVITNQSAIGRGQVERQTVDAIHARMRAEIEGAGGRIDGILICPHRPDEGCNCRKPAPGLLVQAAACWALDLGRSILVGDSEGDILAAQRAGCRPVLVRTGLGARDRLRLAQRGVAGFREAADLAEATAWIWQQLAIREAARE